MHTIEEKKSVAKAMEALGFGATVEEIKAWLIEHEGEDIGDDLKVLNLSRDLIRLNREDLVSRGAVDMSFTTGVNKHGFSLEVKRGNPTHHLTFIGKGKRLNLEVETEGWFELCRALSKVTNMWVEQD